MIIPGLAKKIRIEMAERDIKNQYEVADMMGLSTRKLSGVMNDDEVIKAEDLVAIAEFLNVSIDDLVEEETEEKLEEEY